MIYKDKPDVVRPRKYKNQVVSVMRKYRIARRLMKEARKQEIININKKYDFVDNLLNDVGDKIMEMYCAL